MQLKSKFLIFSLVLLLSMSVAVAAEVSEDTVDVAVASDVDGSVEDSVSSDISELYDTQEENIRT